MFDVPIRYWIQMSSDCNWNRTQNHLVRKRTLSGSGFESSYSHLNFRFCDCFKQGVLWHSGNYRVWIHSETLPWHDKNILPNVKVWYIYKTAYKIQAKDKKKIKIDKTSYKSHAKDTKHQNCITKKALLVLPWDDTNMWTKSRQQKSTSQKHPYQKNIWQKGTQQKGTRFLLVMMNCFLKSALNKEIQYNAKERTTKAVLQKCASKKVC